MAKSSFDPINYSKIKALDSRVDTIITTPISGEGSAQELVDARQGEVTLAANLTGIKQDLVAHKEDYTTHLNATMPHQFTNFKTGKKYRYGYQISVDGIPQIISEEVI